MKDKNIGKLYVVATPIGNLGDISKRALDVLASVDVIAAEDTRHTKILLNHYGIGTKLTAYHKFNEETASKLLVERLLEGCDIAIVTDAGTPCISDPGATLVNLARQNDIDVLPIPGACSAISALSISGYYFSGFEFLGFFPRMKSDQKKLLLNIKNSYNQAFIIFESPNRLKQTLNTMLLELGNLDILVCNDLTKMFERSLRTDLKSAIEAIENDEKAKLGEYVLVLNKPNVKEEKEEVPLSLEALLIDHMVKFNVTTKEAIAALSKDYNKNELYKASLNLTCITTKVRR